MKKIILPLALVCNLLACQSEQSSKSSQQIIKERNANAKPDAAIASANGIDGKALFQANCASCHNPLKDMTGPAIKGAVSRAPSKDWIYNWVKNPAKVLASGDKYAELVYKKYAPTMMTAFPNLKNEEIDAIMSYVDNYSAPN